MRNAVLRYSRLVQGADVRLLTLSALFFMMPHGRAFSGWWNQGWRFRFGIEVQAAGYPRYDRHAEQNVNFTQLLSSLGYSVALDDRSIRVIEVNDAGTVVDSAVVFQFDKDPAYNASTNASGTLVFLMKGVTGATATRHFHVYFETTGGSFSTPSFPVRISVDPNDWDEDQGSVRVDAWGATYYYHKLGGGLSSMDDRNGIDWIDYHSYGGSAGDRRGIPNAVYP